MTGDEKILWFVVNLCNILVSGCFSKCFDILWDNQTFLACKNASEK